MYRDEESIYNLVPMEVGGLSTGVVAARDERPLGTAWPYARRTIISPPPPAQYVEPPKPKMYRSKHDPKTPVTGSTFGIHGR